MDSVSIFSKLLRVANFNERQHTGALFSLFFALLTLTSTRPVYKTIIYY
jgi:hypothetical protein